MKKLIIFDVDGTILDTIETITYHVNKMLKTLDLEAVSSSFTGGILGYSSRYLIEKVLDHKVYPYDEDELERLLDVYHKSYQNEVAYLTKPYSGIVHLLEKLKNEGVLLAALSNKPHHTLSVLFKKIDFNNYFDYVIGQKDEIPKKPNPDMVFEIRDKFGLKNEDLCMVGDTEVDYETAKNAKIEFIAVTWGFRTKDQLLELNPEFIADDITELGALIEREDVL